MVQTLAAAAREVNRSAASPAPWKLHPVLTPQPIGLRARSSAPIGYCLSGMLEGFQGARDAACWKAPALRLGLRAGLGSRDSRALGAEGYGRVPDGVGGLGRIEEGARLPQIAGPLPCGHLPSSLSRTALVPTATGHYYRLPAQYYLRSAPDLLSRSLQHARGSGNSFHPLCSPGGPSSKQPDPRRATLSLNMHSCFQ